MNILDKLFKKDSAKSLQESVDHILMEKDDTKLSKKLRGFSEVITNTSDSKTEYGDNYYNTVTNILNTYEQIIGQVDSDTVQEMMRDLWTIDRSVSVYHKLEKQGGYDNISAKILAVYKKIISEHVDPAVLRTVSFNLDKMTENEIKIRDKENNYDDFFSEITNEQHRLFLKMEEIEGDDDDVSQLSGYLANPLTNGAVIYALRDNYPVHANKVLGMLIDRRSLFKRYSEPHANINLTITKLVSKAEFTPHVDRKILEKQGVLSVKGSKKKLAADLKVIQHYLENKDPAEKNGFKRSITMQIKKRQEFYLNSADVVLDKEDTKMEKIYDNLNDIKNLKAAYNNIQQNNHLEGRVIVPRKFGVGSLG